MFSAIAKIIKGLVTYPKEIVLLLLVLALLCIYPIQHLRWDLQLQDIFNGNDFQVDYENIEEAFGGLGSLTVILQSDDSLKNFQQAEKFARDFQKDSLVHFIEYKVDVKFYEKNRLLYASEGDISQVLDHIEKIKEKEILKNNPFFVSLEEEDNTNQENAPGIIHQIQEKYFQNLQQNFSNADGTIRIIDIYPTQSLTELQSNRNLYNKVSAYMKKNVVPLGIDVHYSGKVYQSVLTGRTLLPEAKFAGVVAAIAFFLILLIYFRRKPQFILISAIPMSLTVLYTLTAAYFLYGRINIFTMALMLLLPGHACQILVHIHTRYYQEWQRKLSPDLCLESAVLGTGPSIAASSLIMAGMLLSLNLVPLPGLREFANLGAIGVMLNVFISPLFATAMLRFTQRKKSDHFEPGVGKPVTLPLLPRRYNLIFIIILSVISFVGIIYSAINLKYLYDFGETEFKHPQEELDQLISSTGFSTYDPIIIMMPDSSYNEKLQEDFKHLQSRGRIPDLGKIYTQSQFLPRESQGKKAKIEYLRHLVTPEILSNLSAEDSSAIVNMLDNYEDDFRDFELSQNITRKFSDKHGNSGVFAFIIPNKNLDNGMVCRHIFKQLQQLEGVQDRKFKVCGTPVLHSMVLDTVLSNVGKSLALSSALLWIILLLFFNNLNHALFVMCPSLFAMSWLIMILYNFNIPLSFYGCLAIVLLVGSSVDGSLQLWSSYFEKPSGSTAITVLRTKLAAGLTSQLVFMMGPLAMIFSSHPGIRSMGQVTLLGLIIVFAAQFTIYPLIAGALDQYRLRKKQRRENERTLH